MTVVPAASECPATSREEVSRRSTASAGGWVGVRVHLAETRARRGPKKRAKTDRRDAR